jgi:hypothetical protein
MVKRQALIWVFFYINTQVIQIIGVLFILTATTLYQGSQMPFSSRFDNRLYLFNDLMVFISAVHLMAFTDVIPDMESKYFSFGWTYSMTTALLTAINVPVIIYTTICSL